MSRTREDFIAEMVGKWGWPYHEVRQILSDAGICQRYAEWACKWPMIDYFEHRKAKALERLTDIAANHGAEIKSQGDPRGYVVRIETPGGFSIGVPAIGYSAAESARIDRAQAAVPRG